MEVANSKIAAKGRMLIIVGVVPYFLDAVPHYAAHAAAVLDEIELEFLVAVQGIQEFALVPFYDIKTVFIGQRGYLS